MTRNPQVKYYNLAQDHSSAGPGLEIVNLDSLQKGVFLPNGKPWTGLSAFPGWPDGYLVGNRGPWQFPRYDEVPQIVVDKKYGKTLKDLAGKHPFFIVSTPMKEVMETYEPGSCEFVRCDSRTALGEPARETWLCSVTRVLYGAVDEESSVDLICRQAENGKPIYSLRSLSGRYALKKSVVGESGIFRLAESFSAVFCNEDFKKQCIKFKLKGLDFYEKAFRIED
jgi:hypothetical protein